MDKKNYTIHSPLMGTFYRASAPGEKSFVKTGQKIAINDVTCVIESMKIFTEIRSERAGIVSKILLENEELVMKDQALIEIKLD